MISDYLVNIIFIVTGLLLQLMGWIGIILYLVIPKLYNIDKNQVPLIVLISMSVLFLVSGFLISIINVVVVVIDKIANQKKYKITLRQEGENIYLLENK